MTAPEIAEPLVIRGTICSYNIEPSRFSLGLSRIEMVDRHIEGLIARHRRHSTDVDVLLDARSMFASTE